MRIERFLIRDDEIQVDKAIYFMRFQITKLREENKQLKNRPDVVQDFKKSLVVRRSKTKIDMSAPIDKWNTHHFLRLFQELYLKKYEGKDFKIRGQSWGAFATRIKQFRDTHEEVRDNREYKNMIEWLFTHKFNKKFVASIPLISSDAMLNQWMVARGSQQTDPEKFRQIAAQTPKSTKELDRAMEDAF